LIKSNRYYVNVRKTIANIKDYIIILFKKTL